MKNQPANFLPSSVMLIDPNDIEIGNRIGFFWPDYAAALGRLMATVGQRTPIEVCRNVAGAQKSWLLVVGRHRTVGAQIEGMPHIKALESEATNEEDLRDLESSENLDRRQLAPIERAMFIYARCEAANLRFARQHGELSAHQRAVKARWDRVKRNELRAEEAIQEELNDTSDKLSSVYGWQDSAAESFGLDKRTIQRSLRLYRLIVEPFPDLIYPLAAHPVVGENASQLGLIASIQDEGQRRKVIEQLLADPELGADVARVKVGIDQAPVAPPTKDVKFTNTLSDTWGRLSLGAQRAYLPRFVGMLTEGQKRELRNLLDGAASEDGVIEWGARRAG